MNALTAGTQTPGGLVASLRQSDDHLKNVDPVTRLYRAFLLRIPDKGGLEFWIKRRRTGTWTLVRIADSFATSSEFKTRYGALSNLDFVKLIYDNVLERPYDSSGLNYWTRQLDLKRKSHGAVMANFSESNEYKTKQAAEVNVSVLDIMMLRRAPTKAEFDTGVAAIEGGKTTATYATELLGTAEYAARFNAPLSVTVPSWPTVYTGLPFQAAFDATGGYGTRTWTATGLPAWATLDPDTGILSGVPTTAGTVTPTIKVTAGSGMVGSKAVPIEVKAGMPAGCASACTSLTAATGTITVPAATVTSVTRNGSGIATSLGVSAAAPNLAVGNILVIGIGDNTPSGLIVKATAITGSDGAARTITVTPSNLDAAYGTGMVKSTADLEPDTTTGTTSARSTRALGCGASANIDITPSATVGLKPNMTLLWGKNVTGFGDVYLGTGGVKLFQFGLDGDLTFKLKGSITGTVDCTLDVPAAKALIPLGPAGFLVFKLTPSLGLKATAGVEIDTTVTVHCTSLYDYRPGTPAYTNAWCKPSYTTPKVSTASTGADLTISGGITASMTFNELVGLNGTITASAHAGYKPLAHPIGILDGKVTAKLTACLACIAGSDAPSLTILDKTLWQKTFATWDTPSPAPNFPLTIATTSLPNGTVGNPYTATLKATGGTKPYTWSATGLPDGLSLAASTGVITGQPTTDGTSSVQLRAADNRGVIATIEIVLTTYKALPSGATSRVTDGDQDSYAPQISSDGRFLVFESEASNLVPNDTNGDQDIFIQDRTTGTITRITNGNGPNQFGYNAVVSGNGRYVAYYSAATNLVPGDTNGYRDIFLWDRVTGSTTAVTEGNRASYGPVISGDGRYVAFTSDATDLVPTDTNQQADAFVWDRVTATTTAIVQGNAASGPSAISADGRYVSVMSAATDLDQGPSYGETDAFLWDRATGGLTRITSGNSTTYSATVSSDGRYVALVSSATNLLPEPTQGGNVDVFRWDRVTGLTTEVTHGNGDSWSARISGDGRYIAIGSWADLAPGGINTGRNVFVWDSATGAIASITRSSAISGDASISADGRLVAFDSEASDLVGGDTNGHSDVFVWDRGT